MDERTRVVTVACAKGGVMKTTTSMQLAGHLARRMHHNGMETPTVVVLDSDNTGGATRWAMVAQEAGSPVPFDVVPVNQAMLNRDWIERHYAGWWVIVDTPPSDTAVIQKAVDCANVTIIPTQPSGMDMMLAGETYASTPDSIVLLGRVKPRTKLTREAIQELDDNKITRFDTVVSEREEIKRIVGTDKVDMKEYSGVTDELLEVFTQLEEEE